MPDPITPVSVTREVPGGISRTVWAASIVGSCGDYSVRVSGVEHTRSSRRHRWRTVRRVSNPPPDVRLELADALCRQVRAAMGVET